MPQRWTQKGHEPQDNQHANYPKSRHQNIYCHAFTSMSSPTNRSSAQDLQKETPGTSKLDEFIISMSFERCDSEPVLCRRRAGRDPAERRFLHFLHDYSQKHRPLSRAQITALVQPWPDGNKTLHRSGSQPSRPKSGPSASPMTAMLRRPSSAPQVESPTKMVAIRQRALSKIAIGLHVALLNAKISQKPGEIQLEEPIGKPRFEQVYRIYRQFLRFKSLEAERAAEVRYLRQEKQIQEAWCDMGEAAATDGDVHLPMEPPLSRLRWSTLIHWLEQEASCGVQQTYRRSVSALLRGVKLWRQLCASREQAEGISLGLLLSWAFPSSTSADIAEMLLWLAQKELETWWHNLIQFVWRWMA